MGELATEGRQCVAVAQCDGVSATGSMGRFWSFIEDHQWMFVRHYPQPV